MGNFQLSLQCFPGNIFDVVSPEHYVMLEGEMLHVAVDARQLAILEDRQSDVQHAVLVLRVLDDEEEAEVARLPGAHHSLVHLLFPLVENAATIRNNDKQLRHCKTASGLGATVAEECGGQVEEADHARLLLLKTKLPFHSSASLSAPLLVKPMDDLCFCTKSERKKQGLSYLAQ